MTDLYPSLVLASSPLAYYRFEESGPGGLYTDSSGNTQNIATGFSSSNVVSGPSFWSAGARYSNTPVATPFLFTGLQQFTFECLFQATSSGTYVIADILSTDTSPEIHIEVGAKTSSPSDWAIKFGLGVGAWTIDALSGDAHTYSIVQSNAVDSIFDGNWHHIVCVWSGLPNTTWNSADLAVYLDGVDVSDPSSRINHLGSSPLNCNFPLNLTAPSGGINTNSASYDEIALYSTALTPAQILAHYNAIAAINSVFESDSTGTVFAWTDGVLRTATETDVATQITSPLPDLLVTATTSVSALISTDDMLSGRDLWGPNGSSSMDLSTSTLEPLEPNAAGYTKTSWIELAINPNSYSKIRVQLTSPTSVGGVTVYKQPSLSNSVNYNSLNTDDILNGTPFSSGPSLALFQVVHASGTDFVFNTDPTYGSSYFLQVGLKSGTGNDFTLTWGDASPSAGGTFASALNITGYTSAPTILSMKNAYLEAGEPDSTGIVETRSVWWKYTAPSVITSGINFKLNYPVGHAYAAEIYTGNALGSLTQVTSGTQTVGGILPLSISPTPGEVYYIRASALVDTFPIQLSWDVPADIVPAKDVVQHLRVMVHAGVAGGTFGGVWYNPGEMITEIINRISCSFQETLNVPGTGTIKMHIDDPAIRSFGPVDWPLVPEGSWEIPTGVNARNTMFAEDPFSLLQNGNIIKFWLGDVCASAFIIKQRDFSIVSTGEVADQTITVSGPTVLHLLDDFVVERDNTNDTTTNQMRQFNWASMVNNSFDLWSNGGWFDSSGSSSSNYLGWNNPYNSAFVTNPPGYSVIGQAAANRPKYNLLKATSPYRWPDLRSMWLWENSVSSTNQWQGFPNSGRDISGGLHYYRTKVFNIPATGWYRFSVCSDAQFSMFLDGDPFMSSNGTENFTTFLTQNVYMYKSSDAVVHQLTIQVQDLDTAGDGFDHNDAIVVNVQQMDSNNRPIRTVLNTSSDNFYAWHGIKPPEWSRAMILQTLIKEAAARGNESAIFINNKMRSSFGILDDTGSPWADTKQYSTSLQIGTSCLDVQAQLSEDLVFDVWMDPDTFELKAWNNQRRNGGRASNDVSANVALAPSVNLINYSVSQSDEIKNRLVVQYGNSQWLTVEFDENDPVLGASSKKYGTREAYLEVGGITDPLAAYQKGEAQLLTTADMSSVSGSSPIVNHLSEKYTGSIRAVKGSMPFVDFSVGDLISAPASNGILHPHKVLSITCNEDDTGNLTFDPELAYSYDSAGI